MSASGTKRTCARGKVRFEREADVSCPHVFDYAILVISHRSKNAATLLIIKLSNDTFKELLCLE